MRRKESSCAKSLVANIYQIGMVMLTATDDDRELVGGGNLRSPIHPLLIDHVVKKILEYADNNDDKVEGCSDHSSSQNLLSYRLVCKLWNEIASSLYKSKQQVEVGSYSTSVPKFRRLIKLRRSFHNKRHIKQSGKNREFGFPPWPCPFTRFRLCQEVFQPLYSTVITDFFQTFQDTLEVLDIWLDLRSTLMEVPIHNGKSNIKCCFPNLKTLVYDDRRVVPEGSEDVRGSLLKSLTELAPNLLSLSIRFQRDFRGSVESGSDAILENMNLIFRNHNGKLTKSLKSLKLDLHVNDALLNCLKCASLRVDSLEMAIRGSTFTFLAFRQFLESLQPYLRKLKLSYIERDSNCLISFPKMSSLCELEIDGTDAFSKHSVSFGDFTYTENLPHLQALRVNIWATVNLRWGQFFPKKIPVCYLTELKLPGELCDRRMMLTTATVFPNLRVLQISLYSITLDAMEVVFECMKQLEELTVMKFPSLWDRNEKNIDHILTGISPSNCDKLWKENANLSKITDKQLESLKCKPGLTDLKNLQKFAMPDLQYQASYTDVSGYLAFNKMANLKKLNVGRSCLGSACLTQLISKYPEMEAQRRMPPTYFKEPEDDDDDVSFLELPGDTCVYL